LTRNGVSPDAFISRLAALRGRNAMESTMITKNGMIAFGVASALAIAASGSALAGPMSIDTGVKSAPAAQTTDVAWRGGWRSGGGWHRGGWGWGGPAVGIGAGLAAGALIGSAVAGAPYGGYYYDDPGYVYGAPYAYDAGPTYYGGYRNWGYGPCYTNEGYGRRTPCDTTGR